MSLKESKKPKTKKRKGEFSEARIRIVPIMDSKKEVLDYKNRHSESWKGWVPYERDSGSWSLKSDRPNPHEQRRKGKAGGGSVKKKNYAYGGRVAKYKD